MPVLQKSAPIRQCFELLKAKAVKTVRNFSRVKPYGIHKELKEDVAQC